MRTSTSLISALLLGVALPLGACTGEPNETAPDSIDGTGKADNPVDHIDLAATIDLGRGEGAPTDRRYAVEIEARLSAAPRAQDLSATLTRTTAGEGGGFGTANYECTTRMNFALGEADVRIRDLASGAVLTTFSGPLLGGARFASPSRAGSTCSPHQFPEFTQVLSANIVPLDGISARLPGGESLMPAGFGLSLSFQVNAANDSGTYVARRIEYHVPASFAGLLGVDSIVWKHLAANGTTVVASGRSALRQRPYNKHQVVRSNLEIDGCDATGTAGTLRYFVSYESSLPPGSRVFVKYTFADEYLGTGGQDVEPWQDGRMIELTPSGPLGMWEGVLEQRRDHLTLYPGDGFRTAAAPAVAFVKFGTRTGSAEAHPALHHVFRIVSPDGTERFENGSSGRWGHYIADVGGYTSAVCALDPAEATESQLGLRIATP